VVDPDMPVRRSTIGRKNVNFTIQNSGRQSNLYRSRKEKANGRVEVVQSPTNPPDGEKIQSVEIVPLLEASRRFESSGRDDLSQLYQLASEVMFLEIGLVVNVL
jgi:hypothetical protein